MKKTGFGYGLVKIFCVVFMWKRKANFKKAWMNRYTLYSVNGWINELLSGNDWIFFIDWMNDWMTGWINGLTEWSNGWWLNSD